MPSTQHECPPIPGGLIEYFRSKIKTLAYKFGENTITMNDVAYIQGESDMLKMIEIEYLRQQQNKNKERRIPLVGTLPGVEHGIRTIGSSSEPGPN